jgi:hypothetical protein
VNLLPDAIIQAKLEYIESYIKKQILICERICVKEERERVQRNECEEKKNTILFKSQGKE